MRTVFVGTSSLSLSTAELLLEEGHQVVIIERDRDRIEMLADRLDAGFIHGDGTSPDVLKDAEPENTDMLFCLLDSDQANILAGLIGRSLGFARIVPRVNDPQFQRICVELGLDESVMPNRAVASHLKDLLAGERSLELSSVIRGEGAVFSAIAGEQDAGPIEDLPLPDRARIVCLYRDETFMLPEPDMRLEEGDELILIAHESALDGLQERWGG
ncbi:potassium channel family protein [Imhoffiella purpurea]|uniref:Trk system potassium uptake protein TrkA n=1 Tax=Imhoffiella purpurea TaxID=1249627 RepID=W9V625_9GAMM|nr:NAD-binding protein [Imhoffiella purpurea]EXJ14804.1 Trk system potassium uptake protein TrkA [Imhoffiella purpurea]